MNNIDTNLNDFIRCIEAINKERINLFYDRNTENQKRKSKIIEEVTHFKIRKILSHIFVRLRPRIPIKQYKYNLTEQEEKELARLGDQAKKVAIFTCITGNYDNPQNLYVKYPNCDYYIVSESDFSTNWEMIRLDKDIIKQYGVSMANRYVKFHPDKFLPKEYDFVIYLDGNIMPISDLSVLCEKVNKEIGIAFHKHCSRGKLSEEYIACLNQNKGDPATIKKVVSSFLNEGMPDEYGLLEGNFYICDLNNKIAISLLHQCWDKMLKEGGGRDQIIWPYILWKNSIKMEDVVTLGNNVWKNVKLLINNHNE